MRFLTMVSCLVLGGVVPLVLGRVVAPYTLGRTCQESTHILLAEVVRVNKDRNLIVYKKLLDLKGQYPDAEIKHHIGQRGFHPREAQTIMTWASIGKKAVLFHNGNASETCIGTYWYQCYREGDWWGMSHAEPYLLRTYCGDAERLAAAVSGILQGREVVVACMADTNKETLHQRKGKMQRLKASLKLLDYSPRRDFVAWGDDDGIFIDYTTYVLLASSSQGWKFLPAKQSAGERWRDFDFDDSLWRNGKSPIGNGVDEINRRGGTTIKEKGEPLLCRRAIEVPAELLQRKDISLRLSVASDDSALVYLNGALVDDDPEPDHDFSYWNRDVALKPEQLRPGRNVIAVCVRNRADSASLYLDMEVVAEIALVQRVAPRTSTAELTPPSR